MVDLKFLFYENNFKRLIFLPLIFFLLVEYCELINTLIQKEPQLYLSLTESKNFYFFFILYF